MCIFCSSGSWKNCKSLMPWVAETQQYIIHHSSVFLKSMDNTPFNSSSYNRCVSFKFKVQSSISFLRIHLPEFKMDIHFEAPSPQ